MAYFTESNTIGFSTQDLSVLNAAMDTVMRDMNSDVDQDDRDQFEKTVCDIINNAWVSGASADDLVNACKKALGA